ncbi:3-hydroxyacyl-CoA dehydrogenase NAD-binding domain-containing protein [Benzoatithermus flavus]|uniref:3-hydroxyacyl-CoA dehydrogenase NAD-binding domain-containing protein n=1 Tax=Benzoatithermus flavus TaxID=3108223 RepID=A0ABU8Y171_9PROT
MEIRQAAVIGAGVMGSGIAAHLANAGIPVLLLDIVPEGAKDRSVLARTALERMGKADPAPFMSPEAAKLVAPGNLEDDLDRLEAADWIVEAIVEEPEAKRQLYHRLEAVRRKGSIVSSNTSTIPLAYLVEGLPESFARDFLITHFFNPPRYMRLLELVAGPLTRPEAAAVLRDFADRRLGKGVVLAKDTPGFIANRIGGFWLRTAIHEAARLGLTVEEADAVMSGPVGIPKTGVFGLLDLVGIDLVPKVAASMGRLLPPGDRYREQAFDLPLIERMIAEGRTGRKGKGGFYRLREEGGRKVKEAIDLATGRYRRSERARPESIEAAKTQGLRALLTYPDRTGRYAWAVLSETLAYAAELVPAISDTIQGVDEAMRLGYNWKYGPFELIDRLGTGWLAEQLQAAGRPVPPLLALAAGRPFYRSEAGGLEQLGPDGAYHPVTRPEGVLLLADIKRTTEPILKNGSAALWDIGDGVACFEFTSKMNALDGDTLDLLARAIPLVAERYRAMVIYNEGTNFSVGANLGLALFALNVGLWSEIEALVQKGQETYRALKYASFPVVGAPSGLALGGGCEILLHCAAVQAHAESYLGLVETGVGIVPAWGGCKEMLLRHMTNPHRPGGPMPPIARVFELIGLATVAKSAAEAKQHLYLRPEDGITMNRDRLLADAKARALAMVEAGWRPPAPPAGIHLPGPTARTALELVLNGYVRLGKATPHDRVVAGALAEVLSGGDTDITEPLAEADLLALERRAFARLVRHPASIARIEHMLETGKPLRN